MYKGGISSYAGFKRASKAKQWLARSTNYFISQVQVNQLNWSEEGAHLKFSIWSIQTNFNS
jgi:hypothetical protein